MLRTPKNKTELISELKKEKDFTVQTVLNGPASTVSKEIAKLGTKRGCTEFCVNGLMTGNRRISRSGYDLKHKESSTQRSH